MQSRVGREVGNIWEEKIMIRIYNVFIFFQLKFLKGKKGNILERNERGYDEWVTRIGRCLHGIFPHALLLNCLALPFTWLIEQQSVCQSGRQQFWKSRILSGWGMRKDWDGISSSQTWLRLTRRLASWMWAYFHSFRKEQGKTVGWEGEHGS